MNKPKEPSTPTALTRSVHQQLLALLDAEPSSDKLNQAFRLLAKWRSHLIENTVVARQGSTIASGPFAGMIYDIRATEGARVARLIGCYEASLTPIIEQIIATEYELVIDIGSAEGYYAIGLARRMLNTKVLARDANLDAQASCMKLAQMNNVEDRVEVGGEWNHDSFSICEKVSTVVICDIEGAEADLLDPDKAEGLRNADILVEVHDCFAPGLADAIAQRFSETHNIQKLGRSLNSSALPDWMEDLSDLDRLTALWEWRAGPTPWLWMTRKSSN